MKGILEEYNYFRSCKECARMLFLLKSNIENISISKIDNFHQKIMTNLGNILRDIYMF